MNVCVNQLVDCVDQKDQVSGGAQGRFNNRPERNTKVLRDVVKNAFLPEGPQAFKHARVASRCVKKLESQAATDVEE